MSAPWQPPTYPPGPPGYGPASTPGAVQDSRGNAARRAGMVAGVAVLVFVAGLVGGIVGAQITSSPAASPPTAAAPPSGPPPATPDPNQVRAQTIDLCTRFAAGYAMLPTPPKTAADIGPAADYIADALRDNGFAEPAIRTTVSDSLRLYHERAAMLSKAPAQGAVQAPSGSWSPAAADAADDAVWSACHGYQG